LLELRSRDTLKEGDKNNADANTGDRASTSMIQASVLQFIIARSKRLASIGALTTLAACGGGGSGSPTPTTHTIGGTVSGLSGTVVLADNGGNQLSLAADGAFTFAAALKTGTAYAVTVATQPSGQTCSVADGTGTVGASNVTNVAVTCTTNPAATYTVGGTVAGLTGSVVLDDNGGNALTVSANGKFTFTTPLDTGVAYAVTVTTQPNGETCTVTQGTGTIAAANVTDVAVTCAANGAQTFTIGGTLAGLNSGASIVLEINGGDALTVSANGTFTFSAGLATGTAYSITIPAQPSGQGVCSVANGQGTIGTADVTNVSVSCPPSVGAATAPITSSSASASALAALVLPSANDLLEAGSLDSLPDGVLITPAAVSQTQAQVRESVRPDTVATTQVYCLLGGTAIQTITAANPTSGFQPGDTVGYVATNCSYNQGEAVSGSEVFTFENYVSANDYTVDLAATNLTATFSGYTFGPYSYSAVWTADNGANSYIYTVNGATVIGAAGFIFNGSRANGTGTINVNYGSGFVQLAYAGWTYDVQTGVPSGGTVTITGANSTKAVITVVSGAYQVVITVSGTSSTYTVAF